MFATIMLVLVMWIVLGIPVAMLLGGRLGTMTIPVEQARVVGHIRPAPEHTDVAA